MKTDRPYMPGYGLKKSRRHMLKWEWAEEHLVKAHDYWVATIAPDGHPSVTPVWGLWREGAVWFSCSPESRKSRNLDRDPRCTVTTDEANNPVIVEGRAERVTDLDVVAEFGDHLDLKYLSDFGEEFYMKNACWRVVPQKVIGLTDSDFTGSPTRWTFP